jgi:phage terminase large subunit-like protein
MSTAGDDPSSWGYERYRYGQQVAKGERDDLRFLHVEYGIPDTVSEVDLAKDLVKWGKVANPAWGYTVKPSEFVDDFNRSKGRPVEMAGFLQYRVNRWVGSTNRWLDQAGWALGKVDLVPKKYLASLTGRECYLGLDLARRLDMTAAVFLFPWPESGEEAVRIWPMFWLPEERAEEQDNLFPFKSWGRKGHLHLTPGSVTDYGRVKHDLRTVVEEHGFDVRALYFDKLYAEELTQNLVDGESNPATGGVIYQGWGCDRFEFKQDVVTLASPSAEFERRVKAGLVEHPGNEVMDWQVGHCEGKKDVNQNVRPVKPEPHSGKKVDGILAAVMALYGAMKQEDEAPRVR